MYEEMFLILQEKVIKESNEAIKKWNIKKYLELENELEANNEKFLFWKTTKKWR